MPADRPRRPIHKCHGTGTTSRRCRSILNGRIGVFRDRGRHARHPVGRQCAASGSIGRLGSGCALQSSRRCLLRLSSQCATDGSRSKARTLALKPTGTPPRAGGPQSSHGEPCQGGTPLPPGKVKPALKPSRRHANRERQSPRHVRRDQRGSPHALLLPVAHRSSAGHSWPPPAATDARESGREREPPESSGRVTPQLDNEDGPPRLHWNRFPTPFRKTRVPAATGEATVVSVQPPERRTSHPHSRARPVVSSPPAVGSAGRRATLRRLNRRASPPR